MGDPGGRIALRQELTALAWVLGIAAWQIRTHRTRRRRRREAAEIPDRADGALTPEEAAMASDRSSALEAALADLSPGDAETLIAYARGEHPDLPGPTFRKRVERALRRLRARWRFHCLAPGALRILSPDLCDLLLARGPWICALGGVAAGLVLGLRSRGAGGAPFWSGAALSFALAAVLGCLPAGAMGFTGLLSGLVAGGLPGLAARRASVRGIPSRLSRSAPIRNEAAAMDAGRAREGATMRSIHRLAATLIAIGGTLVPPLASNGGAATPPAESPSIQGKESPLACNLAALAAAETSGSAVPSSIPTSDRRGRRDRSSSG